jgi:anaerobic C4-dicarboxylate transporter
MDGHVYFYCYANERQNAPAHYRVAATFICHSAERTVNNDYVTPTTGQCLAAVRRSYAGLNTSVMKNYGLNHLFQRVLVVNSTVIVRLPNVFYHNKHV